MSNRLPEASAHTNSATIGVQTRAKPTSRREINPVVEQIIRPESLAQVRQYVLQRVLLKREIHKAVEQENQGNANMLFSFAQAIGIDIEKPYMQIYNPDAATPEESATVFVSAVRDGEITNTRRIISKLYSFFVTNQWNEFSQLLEFAGQHNMIDEDNKRKFEECAQTMLDTLLPGTRYKPNEVYGEPPQQFIQKMICVANAGITLDWFGRYGEVLPVKHKALIADVSAEDIIPLIQCGILRDPELTSAAIHNVYYNRHSIFNAFDVISEALQHGIALESIQHPWLEKDAVGYDIGVKMVLDEVRKVLAEPLKLGLHDEDRYNMHIRLMARKAGISFTDSTVIHQEDFDRFMERKVARELDSQFPSLLIEQIADYVILGMENPARYKMLVDKAYLGRFDSVSFHDLKPWFTTGNALGLLQIPDQEAANVLLQLSSEYTDAALTFGFYRMAQDNVPLESGLPYEDMDWFKHITQIAENVNSVLPEGRRVKDVSIFLSENIARIGKLVGVHRQRAGELIESLMKHHGFPRLQQALNLVDDLSESTLKALNTFVQITQNVDGLILERFLELAAGFKSTYRETVLFDILDQLQKGGRKLDRELVLKTLGKAMLEAFNEKYQFGATITEDNFALWDYKLISKLASGIEKEKWQPGKDLFLIILKATLQGDFATIMSNQQIGPEILSKYSPQEQAIIEKIHTHNTFVEEACREKGLDFDAWTGYKGERKVSGGITRADIEVGQNRILEKLYEVTERLLGSKIKNIPGIIIDKNASTKLFKLFPQFQLKLENGKISSQHDFTQLGKFLKTYRDFISALSLNSHSQSISEIQQVISDLDSLIAEHQVVLESKKHMGYELRFKLWDRQPGHDFFQGNYTHCCIAVGYSNEPAIADYLVDRGTNIIEVVDDVTGQTMAQAFIYMHHGENGTMLMIDNMEINAEYAGINTVVMDNMFAYLNEFADVLEKKGGKINGIRMGIQYNEDVPWGQLSKETMIIQKLGGVGYLGWQYFDSLGGTWLDTNKPVEREVVIVERKRKVRRNN